MISHGRAGKNEPDFHGYSHEREFPLHSQTPFFGPNSNYTRESPFVNPHVLELCLYQNVDKINNNSVCLKQGFTYFYESFCISSVRKMLSSLEILLLLLMILKSLSLLSKVLPRRFILAVRAVIHLQDNITLFIFWESISYIYSPLRLL